jgi:hypothetical protein
MSEPRFTPGPWSLPHFANPDCKCKCGYVLVDGYCGAVAKVYYSQDRELEHGDNPPFDEACANANLIAAAPDLYAALEGIANADQGEWQAEYRTPTEFRRWAKNVARAALAKAVK